MLSDVVHDIWMDMHRFVRFVIPVNAHESAPLAGEALCVLNTFYERPVSSNSVSQCIYQVYAGFCK